VTFRTSPVSWELGRSWDFEQSIAEGFPFGLAFAREVLMAFVVSAADRSPGVIAEGMRQEWVISPDRLPDGRLSVEVLYLDPETALDLGTASDELLWLEVLRGSIMADAESTGSEIIVMVAGGRGVRIQALTASELLIVRVPHAARYDDVVRGGLAGRVDWSTEPVLDSEHDARRRIYLATTELWGTEAVKGERIYYPAGAAGAPHHHEGAEHFQFVVAGSGTALLDGTPIALGTGDLLYNLENEIHAFRNDADEDFVFVEFFVPGHSRTVWVPGVEVCTWQPRETDVHGRPAARALERHVHGEGRV